MADTVTAKANVGAGTEKFIVDQIGADLAPSTKIMLGDDGVDGGFVSGANPMPIDGVVSVSGPVDVAGTFWPATQPISASALPLPAGAATETSLAALVALNPALTDTVPFNGVQAPPSRLVGQDVWTCSFAQSGSSVLSPDFITPIVGTGVTYNQTSGSLNILTGTNTNAEFLTRSVRSWRGALRMRFSIVASQRIANQNLAVVLADLLGAGLTYNIVNSTTVDVTDTAHGLTAQNVGQFMNLGGITGAAGVPGRYAIASIVDANTIRFTVAGWPASGTGTLTLFGWNYCRNLYNGTTATSMLWDCQRRGWASGDTTASVLTTASPGAIVQNDLNGRDAFLLDQLRATSAVPNFISRGSRYENMPDDDVELYMFIWNFNGTVAPASTTTWTLGFISVEKFANLPVYIQGQRANGNNNPLPVLAQGTTPVSLATNTPTLAAGTNRAGFLAQAGIWYDDSATTLAANATFTGTSRDVTGVATATAFNVATTYGQELVFSAESDVAGTLWLEVSRDNTNWRRVKSVATAAVTGGGQYAEIVHKPSWRYLRVGYTNGATIQARFSIGSIMRA
jgi:hypothetical protein